MVSSSRFADLDNSSRQLGITQFFPKTIVSPRLKGMGVEKNV